MYGNKWGSDEHETELIATFQSQGTDLDLLATGYDIDFADEVSVTLNGLVLGYLSEAPNHKLNAGDFFAFSRHTISWFERASFRPESTGLEMGRYWTTRGCSQTAGDRDSVLPDAAVDVPYDATLRGSGGTPPYTELPPAKRM